jgi:methyltransferase (TIGR00027 family)
MHVLVDDRPPVLDDELGLRLVAPDAGWRDRPDMHPDDTRGFRASIVARARFVEVLVTEQATGGVDQYVILGAGLDTLAERRPDLAARMPIFEVDRPATQAWKRDRLAATGIGVPDALRLVPIDFETGGRWWDGLRAGASIPTERPSSRPPVAARYFGDRTDGLRPSSGEDLVVATT